MQMKAWAFAAIRLPYCGTEDSFRMDSYSEATLTTRVGWRACRCGGFSSSWGRTTQYRVYTAGETC
ncbi:hypothetical protein JGU66_23340 [Myxococcaceae bacterium JPH2]|nr:hypothetical protein [Myxococcaceae bacterium JPH2]